MADQSLGSKSPPAGQNIDTLSISHLSLDHGSGILAPYVFGERKVQPATVSLSLDLDQGFSSAASADALDQNTIHYGNLAKSIRDKRPEGQTLEDFMSWVEIAVDGLALRREGTSRVGKSVVSIELPKASAAGEEILVTSERPGLSRRDGRWIVKVAWRSVRVMLLIGVNSVERTAKQALEVDLEVASKDGTEVLRRDVEIFGLEREMVQIIEPTSFETLESLGEHVVKHLTPKIQEALPSCYMMNLTMRKPKAIAFAEAPALSLTRVFPRGAERKEGSVEKLRLIKPYV